MIILHLIHSLSGGGAEKQLTYLAPALAQKGYDVHIVYVEEGPFKQHLPGVSLHKISVDSNYSPKLFFNILKIIRNIRPDIIQTWILQMDILGGLAASIARIPWILREPSCCYLKNWKSYLRVLVASKAAAIVANSSGGYNYWQKKLRYVKKFIFRNGVPLNEIENISANMPAEFYELDDPIILYVGRLDIKQKRPDEFLKILALTREKCRARGILCGDGPNRKELENMSNDLGIKDYVKFVGFLPPQSLWALMKKSSIFLSLSDYEGCPNSVIEAAACECPLILSDIPSHRELFDDDCAFFVEKGDDKKVVETIENILNGNHKVKEKVIAAKKKIKYFSVESMVEQFDKIYNIISR